MLLSSWLRGLRGRAETSQPRSVRKQRHPRLRHRPRLELLEDRTVPSTFTVTNTLDDGSLRWAVNQVNADATDTVAQPDTVNFAITSASGTGIATILVGSTLPVNAPVVINGYTQTGASPNTLPQGDNAVLKVELNGGGISSNGDTNPGDYAVLALGNGVTVKGLVINVGTGVGVLCSGTGDTLSGNFIGTDVTGTVAEGNTGADVWALYSSGAIVGGTTPDARNVISGTINTAQGFALGNTGEGILDQGSGTTIEGNFVGTDAGGTQSLANSQAGIWADGTNLALGGTAAGARNVVSGNTGNGNMFVEYTTGTKIQGNYIGTDATGKHAVLAPGAASPGIYLETQGVPQSVVIGGTTAGAGNLISGNSVGI
jgi:hypothetical protein